MQITGSEYIKKGQTGQYHKVVTGHGEIDIVP